MFVELAHLGVSGLALIGNGLIFGCPDSCSGEMDLYIWCLNLYFVQTCLHLVSELILVGKRALGPWDPGPNGTRAQMGPGPKWDPDPNGTRAQMGPGLNWAQGPNGPGPNGPGRMGWAEFNGPGQMGRANWAAPNVPGLCDS